MVNSSMEGCNCLTLGYVITKATQPARRNVEKMMVAMSLSIESTGASGRTERPPVPGSWIDVSGTAEGGPSSIPLSLTFYMKAKRHKNEEKGRKAWVHLLKFCIKP